MCGGPQVHAVQRMRRPGESGQWISHIGPAYFELVEEADE